MKGNKGILIIIILSLIGVIICYPYLPDKVPIHWNINWEVDGWGDRWTILFLAFLPLVLYFFYTAMPYLDPKRENYKKFGKTYSIIRYVIIIFLVFMNWITLLTALNYNINIKIISSVGLGIMCILFGNYLPLVRRNFFLGIKNPWTLTNDVVWKKTHRVGGYYFVLFGILCLPMAFVQKTAYNKMVFGMMLLGVVAINIYSYLLYRKEKERKEK